MLTKGLAYQNWLGIREDEQPPTLYRLLALNVFESDKELIANAADSRIGYVRQFQTSENASVAGQILNELARAQIILLNPQKKAAYDAQLRNAPTNKRANPWDGGPESSSQSAVARGVNSRSGKTIPQARAIEPLQAISIADVTTNAEVDVESLVSESASPASRKRPTKQPSRKSKTPAIAIALTGGILAGCVVGLLAYYFLVYRQEVPNKVAKNSVPVEPSKSAESHPQQAEKAPLSNGDSDAGRKQKPITQPPLPDKHPDVALLKPVPEVHRTPGYDKEHLKKDLEEIKRLSKAVKTPADSGNVAEKAMILADRAIVLEDAQTAKEITVISLAAARNAESIPLARRATVLLIQLQAPLSDTLKQIAVRRLGRNVEGNVAESPEETHPVGPSLRNDDATKAAVASASHDAKWGKTEDQRRKIFFDLLKAVDDYGMTPEGKNAWKSIEARNGIDARVTLGILNEGFGTFSDWDQPDGGGRATARANRMNWIAARTRTMREPMLTD
jgi:hypothetical protein